MKKDFLQHKFVPKEGFRYTSGRTSTTVSMLAIGKEGAEFSEPMIDQFGIAVLNRLRNIRNKDSAALKDASLMSSMIDLYTIEDFVPYEGRYVYKYVPEEYLPYYVKGWFKLGTIDHYRKIENAYVKDEFEGHSIFHIKASNREVLCGLTGGYNSYIFCSTDRVLEGESPDQYMQDKFGDVLIKIDLHDFAERMCKRIRARSYKIFRVLYSNSKVFKSASQDLEIDVNRFDIGGFIEQFMDSCVIPCLFIKPAEFSPEQEIRIAFQMPYEVSAPKKLQHTGLLKHVKVLNR